MMSGHSDNRNHFVGHLAMPFRRTYSTLYDTKDKATIKRRSYSHKPDTRQIVGWTGHRVGYKCLGDGIRPPYSPSNAHDYRVVHTVPKEEHAHCMLPVVDKDMDFGIRRNKSLDEKHMRLANGYGTKFAFKPIVKKPLKNKADLLVYAKEIGYRLPDSQYVNKDTVDPNHVFGYSDTTPIKHWRNHTTRHLMDQMRWNVQWRDRRADDIGGRCYTGPS